MPTPLDKEKLAKLLEMEGFDTFPDLAQAFISDSLAPAICMNPQCDYSTEMEQDQDQGWCEVCDTGSMKSAFVLAGII